MGNHFNENTSFFFILDFCMRKCACVRACVCVMNRSPPPSEEMSVDVCAPLCDNVNWQQKKEKKKEQSGQNCRDEIELDSIFCEVVDRRKKQKRKFTRKRLMFHRGRMHPTIIISMLVNFARHQPLSLRPTSAIHLSICNAFDFLHNFCTKNST